MWNKVIIWTARLGSIALVFIAPIVYLIWKYGGVEVVEETQSSMPIPILLLITGFALIIIMWLSSQVIVLYWDYIKHHPFGAISTMSFGSIILILTLLGIQWVNKLNDLIEYNAQRFMDDLSMYRGSMYVVVIYVSIGLGLALAGFIWEKATST
jgi:hypothetical protein